MIRLRVRKKLFGPQGPMDFEADLTVKSFETMGLFGISGSGKTTLLRMIAGLEVPDEGIIEKDGLTWFDSAKRIHVPPQHRNCGIVFQDYALFPHMTVEGNLRYAAGEQRSPELIEHLLEVTELDKLRDRKPTTLSGGQKQRVALARAIARSPDVLLLDEVMSSLDTELRNSLLSSVAGWHKEFKLTTLIVSHDVHEILRLADRVALVESGSVRTPGPPESQLFGDATERIQAEVLRVNPAPEGGLHLTCLLPHQVVRVNWSRENAPPKPGESLTMKLNDSHCLLG